MVSSTRWPVALVGVLVAGCVSCSSSPPVTAPTSAITSTPSPSIRATPEPSMTSLTISAGCPRATGYLVVRGGDLSIGPFEDESAQPQRADTRKLWVASQKLGPDEVTIEVTGPDGVTQTQTRGPSSAQVSNASQFWPGEIPVPTSGDYRIRATVADEHLCVSTSYYR